MSAIAQLKALFSIDTKQGEAAIDSIGNKVKQLGSNQLAGLKGMIAGAFSIGAITAFGRSLMQTADNMANIAAATNLTMGQLVALKSVSADNKVKFEDLANTLGKLRNAQGEVVNLSKPMEAALKTLGINAEKFVAADTASALEMIANGYVSAGGSANAFSAVQDILGKQTKGLVEMLKALNAEGMDALIEKTAGATEGFNKLADAQSTIEKFFNAVQIGAANAIAAVSKFGEEMGKLSVEKPDQGFLSSVFESIGKVYFDKQYMQDLGGRKAKSPAAAQKAIEASPEVQKRRENQAAISSKEATKQAEQLTENEKRRDELYRQMDDLAIESQNKQQEILGGKLGAPERGRVDSLQAVGGLIGGAGGTPSDRRAERMLRVNEDMKKEIEKTNRQLEDLNRRMEELAGVE